VIFLASAGALTALTEKWPRAPLSLLSWFFAFYVASKTTGYRGDAVFSALLFLLILFLLMAVLSFFIGKLPKASLGSVVDSILLPIFGIFKGVIWFYVVDIFLSTLSITSPGGVLVHFIENTLSSVL